MDKTIEIARCTLAEMFNIDKDSFDLYTRKRSVIEAKRYLIYFLVTEIGMKFSHISKYIKSIKSHATAMHHYYKMIDILGMKHEAATQTKYMQFRNQVLDKGMDKLEKELNKQIEMRRVINWNIKQLRQMISEA